MYQVSLYMWYEYILYIVHMYTNVYYIYTYSLPLHTYAYTQVEENLGALGWSLTPAEVESIDRAASRVGKQLVQNSFQSR